MTTVGKTIIVKGDLQFDDAVKIHSVLTNLKPSLVVHGGRSTGAEFLAKVWAEMMGVDHEMSYTPERKYPEATVVRFNKDKVTIQTVLGK